ncbi:MAG: hypothetical protein JNM18_09855 [Planctomycetaceae bacterium]|nr:hypothetical protein [Planctomycetaceae bacterium]
MSQGLSPQNEQFITDAVARGLFPTREAVLDQALDHLRHQRAAHEELERELQKGLDDIAAGRVVEMDDEEIEQMMLEVIEQTSRQHHG